MSSADRFKPYVPDVQAVVRLDEALPPEHPVHVFVDPVQGVDLSHFVIPPGPKGEKPYHPHALFGILAWGYLHGVRSSRKLARLARQEATFVYLAGGGQPNYRTLARFRREHAAAFRTISSGDGGAGAAAGACPAGHVALDGTQLKANTSKHKAMSYGRMRQRKRSSGGDRAAARPGRDPGCGRGIRSTASTRWLFGGRGAGAAGGPAGEDPGGA
jgi:transposase